MSAEATMQDGAAFYQGDSLHITFYDMLYGNVASSHYGDLEWYDALATHTGPRILDAGCGSGRVALALKRPGRDICAIDASAEMLQQAYNKASANPSADCRIVLSPQRLESFRFDSQFDLILLTYYSFSSLLHPEQRLACLKQVAAHLAPEGRAVLHLPAPELLRREVPPEELRRMQVEHKVNTGFGPSLLLAQFVSAMRYDAATNQRSMDLYAVLMDDAGNIMRQDMRRLVYACITAEDLAATAAEAGLAVLHTRSGFKQETGTELVAVLIHAPR